MLTDVSELADRIANSENFSLQEFFTFSGATLHERLKPFNEYRESTRKQGLALYGREIIGPTGTRVQVRDTVTGSVRSMLMMGSNNYLGLANHPLVKKAVIDAIEVNGVGMAGPPLLNGMSSLHRELERKIATLKGKEDALLFASGFQANLGWISALLRSKDYLIYDELHHASVFDGIKIARAVARIHTRSFRHNNAEHLEKILQAAQEQLSPGAHIFIAVEGVYSMDGDLAPLREIAALATQYGATLILDDAHGTGILGKRGSGTAEHFGVCDQVELAMGTFSKALGVTGGFIAGKREVIEYLRYFSSSYMFSAHLPQAIVAAVIAGLDVIESQPALRGQLHDNVAYMLRGMNEIGYAVKSESAIIPVVLPENIEIRALGKRFHEEGLFTNLIEYPAVPKNAQRIRLSVMADHSREDLDFGLAVLEKLGREFSLI